MQQPTVFSLRQVQTAFVGNLMILRRSSLIDAATDVAMNPAGVIKIPDDAAA